MHSSNASSLQGHPRCSLDPSTLQNFNNFQSFAWLFIWSYCLKALSRNKTTNSWILIPRKTGRVTPGPRSNSAIDLQAAKRAQARTVYANLNRMRATPRKFAFSRVILLQFSSLHFCPYDRADIENRDVWRFCRLWIAARTDRYRPRNRGHYETR